ncbi:aromatic-ring hydroxylase C-terminal domain-containing protein [Roseateles sp. GG27B]
MQAFQNAAQALSVPLTVIEDEMSGQLARYEAHLILIRPDQFVAWVGHEAGLSLVAADQVIRWARGDSIKRPEHAQPITPVNQVGCIQG